MTFLVFKSELYSPDNPKEKVACGNRGKCEGHAVFHKGCCLNLVALFPENTNTCNIGTCTDWCKLCQTPPLIDCNSIIIYERKKVNESYF